MATAGLAEMLGGSAFAEDRAAPVGRARAEAIAGTSAPP
jgi:hypothetical protein